MHITNYEPTPVVDMTTVRTRKQLEQLAATNDAPYTKLDASARAAVDAQVDSIAKDAGQTERLLARAVAVLERQVDAIEKRRISVASPGSHLHALESRFDDDHKAPFK